MPAFKSPTEANDKLTKLMLKAVPKNELGRKTLTHLAQLIGVSKWGLRKWINAQKIPPERAMDIVRISEGRVKIEDFHEFVYKP
jgi:hypothetical protein